MGTAASLPLPAVIAPPAAPMQLSPSSLVLLRAPDGRWKVGTVSADGRTAACSGTESELSFDGSSQQALPWQAAPPAGWAQALLADMQLLQAIGKRAVGSAGLEAAVKAMTADLEGATTAALREQAASSLREVLELERAAAAARTQCGRPRSELALSSRLRRRRAYAYAARSTLPPSQA